MSHGDWRYPCHDYIDDFAFLTSVGAIQTTRQARKTSTIPSYIQEMSPLRQWRELQINQKVYATIDNDGLLHVRISYQLATFMKVFTHKLATYLSTGDVAGFQKRLYFVHVSCSVLWNSWVVQVSVRVSFVCVR